MFTGIVDRVATVATVARLERAVRLEVDTGYVDLVLGESVAVDGVCLTVVEVDATGRASFFVSEETLSRSSLAGTLPGSLVNLERAVTLATRLSGHLVQGHVDGLGRLTGISHVGDSRRVTISLAADLGAFCVEKGSIAIAGVSLTINSVTAIGSDGRFSVDINLIPHTWDHTNFDHLHIGDSVNVEVDVIAKYIGRLCHVYLNR